MADHQNADLAVRHLLPDETQHLIGFSRGQYGGGFIQNQNFTLQIKLLQDFQLLLLSRRQLRDRKIQRNLKWSRLHEGGQFFVFLFQLIRF